MNLLADLGPPPGRYSFQKQSILCRPRQGTSAVSMATRVNRFGIPAALACSLFTFACGHHMVRTDSSVPMDAESLMTPTAEASAITANAAPVSSEAGLRVR